MKKRLAALGLVAIMCMSLAACGKGGPTKEELQSDNDLLTTMVADYEEQVGKLEQTIEALSGREGPLESISSVSDGSGKKTFNSIGGKILFPGELKYTNATQAPNTSKLNLSDKISIVPSDNWVVQINGTTTQYSHPSGVYGTIKVASIVEIVKASEIDETILKPFIDTIPHISEELGSIFIEDNWRGRHATMTILNNEKPAVLKCGVIGYSDISMSYTFYYDGDIDSNKTELINSLLKTISFGSQKMRIE